MKKQHFQSKCHTALPKTHACYRLLYTTCVPQLCSEHITVPWGITGSFLTHKMLDVELVWWHI